MIEIDPLLYLGENYLVRWQCPSCKERAHIRLGKIDTARCPKCAQQLSQEDRKAFHDFKRLIA